MKLPSLLRMKNLITSMDGDNEVDMKNVSMKLRCKSCNRKGWVMNTGSVEIKKPCRNPSCGMLEMGLPIVVRKHQATTNVVEFKPKLNFPRTTGEIWNFDDVNKKVNFTLISDVDWDKEYEYTGTITHGSQRYFGYGDWM